MKISDLVKGAIGSAAAVIIGMVVYEFSKNALLSIAVAVGLARWAVRLDF